MHTYRKCVEGKDDNADKYVWVVGYYTLESHSDGVGSQSQWNPLSEHPTELGAIKRVNFLNGGEWMSP